MTVTVPPWSQEPNNCMIKEEGYKEITPISFSISFPAVTQNKECATGKTHINQGIQLQYLMALANPKKLKPVL